MIGRAVARFGLPFIDQGILSFANFLASLICLRALQINEYGKLTTGLAVVYFIVAAVQGFVVTPGSTRTVRWNIGRRDRHSSASRSALWVILIVSGFALAALAALVSLLLPEIGIDLRYVALILFAGSAMSLWEFDRTYLAHEKRYSTGLACTTGYAIALLGTLFGAQAMKVMSLEAAFVAFGTAGLAACLLRSTRPGFLLHSAWSTWTRFRGWGRRGKASLSLNLMWWGQLNAYLLIVSFVAGPAAAGALAATRLVFAPLYMLLAAWARISLPYLALDQTARSHHRASSAIRYSLLFNATIVLGIGTATLFGYEWIDQLLFRGKVDDGFRLIASWTLYFMLVSVNAVLANHVLANGRFGSLAKMTVVQTLVAAVAVAICGALDFRLVPFALLLAELSVVWWIARASRAVFAGR